MPKIKPISIRSILLIAIVVFSSPRLVWASGGEHHGGGADDSSPEPSHHSSPDSSPEPSHSEDNHHASPSPTPESSATPDLIESGSNEKLKVSDEETGAVFKLQRKQKARRRVVSQDKFGASLKLPVPTLSVGVATSEDARIAEVSLKLSRAGSDYAECTLDFSPPKRARTGSKAEYKIEIEQKLKKRVVSTKVKKGACDNDLLTEGVQSDFPNLQNGDSYILEVNGVAIISGNF